MSTHAQALGSTVRVAIVVEVPIDRAFRVFTDEFDRIKPREHNMLGVDIAETVFEPRAGGRVYDRGVDGSEFQWARVLAFEPPHRLVFSWDLSPQWQIESDLDKTSEVEVRFIDEAGEPPASSSSTATSIATATAGKPARRHRRRRRLAALSPAFRGRDRRAGLIQRGPDELRSRARGRPRRAPRPGRAWAGPAARAARCARPAGSRRARTVRSRRAS